MVTTFSPICICTDPKTKAQKENGKRAGRGPGKKGQVPKIEEVPTPTDACDKLAEPTAGSEIVNVSEETPSVPLEPSKVEEEVGPVTTATSAQDGALLHQGRVNLECGQPAQEAAGMECGQPTGDAAGMEGGQPTGDATSMECGQPTGDAASVECGQPTGDAASVECGQPTGDAAGMECGQPTGDAAGMECGQVIQEPGSTECGQPQENVSVECRQPTQKTSSMESGQETEGN